MGDDMPFEFAIDKSECKITPADSIEVRALRVESADDATISVTYDYEGGIEFDGFEPDESSRKMFESFGHLIGNNACIPGEPTDRAVEKMRLNGSSSYTGMILR